MIDLLTVVGSYLLLYKLVELVVDGFELLIEYLVLNSEFVDPFGVLNRLHLPIAVESRRLKGSPAGDACSSEPV
jgi:hypothetical protein